MERVPAEIDMERCATKLIEEFGIPVMAFSDAQLGIIITELHRFMSLKDLAIRQRLERGGEENKL